MKVNQIQYKTIWYHEGEVHMINQLLLPFRFEIFTAKTLEETCLAIKTMIVRGAGAIGAAAGFAMAQAARKAPESGYLDYITDASIMIKNCRPTAYNLFYAVEKVFAAALEGKEQAEEEAKRLAEKNIEDGYQIGLHGLSLIKPGMRILTHCNAGWLAFVDWGSALAPVYHASRKGMNPFVWVGETRPRSQGARLTAWELYNEEIQHTIVADNAVASLMSSGKIDLVITGADCIALNGDTANKTGTLDRAILARHFKIPFFIAAPASTFDPHCETGAGIKIEMRHQDEVKYQEGPDEEGEIRKINVSNPASMALNPAFDVTPSILINGIITEKGILNPRRSDISRFLETD